MLNEYDQLIQSICKDSYYHFFIEAWKVLEPTTPLVDNWHIKYLCDSIQAEVERIARLEPKPNNTDLIVNMPPRSLKSYIFTIMLNAWAWAKYPHLKFITASYSSDLSTEHAVKTRNLIESDWYQRLFATKENGLSVDQNTKSKFTNIAGGERRATSVGGTLTGAGSDIIVVDDPLKADEGWSEAMRRNANDWYSQTLYTRLNDQKIGLRVLVMQRLHEDDITGNLLSKGGYRHICLPAELTDNTTPELIDKYIDGLLFPSRFDRETLRATEQQMGSLVYAGQMLQNPQPLGGNLIKREFFGSFTAIPELLQLPRNYYSDTAYGKDKSDNSATICYSLHEGDLLIWNILLGNFSFDEFIKAYKAFLQATHFDSRSKCIFEPKATGISTVQVLKREQVSGQYLNVVEDSPPTESKEARVQAALPFFESGRVKLLTNQAWHEPLIQECMAFPRGKHDDQVDALVGAILRETSKPKVRIAFV